MGCIGLSPEEAQRGSEIREKEPAKWESLNLKNGKELNQTLQSHFERHRPFNVPYFIVGELKLMRRYPHILREWLLLDKHWKKDNPNYNAIMTYLKKAKRRPDVNAWCSKMNYDGWMTAYKCAVDGKCDPKGSFDENYVQEDNEFGMDLMEHAHSRLTVQWHHTWTIPNLVCNDWGMYQLITEYFLKHKDERVWKWLLSDDGYGIQNVAIGTAKVKNEFRVTLMWYTDVANKAVPTYVYAKAGSLKSNQCIDQYAFRMRRCFKYDSSCGYPTPPGVGETHADQPRSSDKPGDNPPKKPLPKGSYVWTPPQPIDCKTNADPAICDNIPGAKKAKKPKTPPTPPKPLPPKEQRKQNDKKAAKNIKANLAVRQVIDFQRHFTFVESK